MDNLAKLEKRLKRDTARAVIDFNLIEPDDHIMVCLSGGKDSYTLLDMLLHLQRVAPIDFSLTAINLDQKQPDFPEQVLPDYLQNLGVDYQIVEADTFSIVKERIPEGQTTCGLCSRLRRGILYRTATTIGATKIALGHHADDLLETLLLNLFHGGSLKTMPVKLHADNGTNVVIRPLAYCREAMIERYAAAKQYPIIPCNLCGSQPNLQRQAMKAMLQSWEATDPMRIASMLTALGNVKPSHLLDDSLFDFDKNERIAGHDSDGAAKPDSEPGADADSKHGNRTRKGSGQATNTDVVQVHRIDVESITRGWSSRPTQ